MTGTEALSALAGRLNKSLSQSGFTEEALQSAYNDRTPETSAAAQTIGTQKNFRLLGFQSEQDVMDKPVTAMYRSIVGDVTYGAAARYNAELANGLSPEAALETAGRQMDEEFARLGSYRKKPGEFWNAVERISWTDREGRGAYRLPTGETIATPVDDDVQIPGGIMAGLVRATGMTLLSSAIRIGADAFGRKSSLTYKAIEENLRQGDDEVIESRLGRAVAEYGGYFAMMGEMAVPPTMGAARVINGVRLADKSVRAMRTARTVAYMVGQGAAQDIADDAGMGMRAVRGNAQQDTHWDNFLAARAFDFTTGQLSMALSGPTSKMLGTRLLAWNRAAGIKLAPLLEPGLDIAFDTAVDFGVYNAMKGGLAPFDIGLTSQYARRFDEFTGGNFARELAFRGALRAGNRLMRMPFEGKEPESLDMKKWLVDNNLASRWSAGVYAKMYDWFNPDLKGFISSVDRLSMQPGSKFGESFAAMYKNGRFDADALVAVRLMQERAQNVLFDQIFDPAGRIKLLPLLGQLGLRKRKAYGAADRTLDEGRGEQGYRMALSGQHVKVYLEPGTEPANNFFESMAGRLRELHNTGKAATAEDIASRITDLLDGRIQADVFDEAGRVDEQKRLRLADGLYTALDNHFGDIDQGAFTGNIRARLAALTGEKNADGKPRRAIKYDDSDSVFQNILDGIQGSKPGVYARQGGRELTGTEAETAQREALAAGGEALAGAAKAIDRTPDITGRYMQMAHAINNAGIRPPTHYGDTMRYAAQGLEKIISDRLGIIERLASDTSGYTLEQRREGVQGALLSIRADMESLGRYASEDISRRIEQTTNLSTVRRFIQGMGGDLTSKLRERLFSGLSDDELKARGIDLSADVLTNFSRYLTTLPAYRQSQARSLAGTLFMFRPQGANLSAALRVMELGPDDVRTLVRRGRAFHRGGLGLFADEEAGITAYDGNESRTITGNDASGSLLVDGFHLLSHSSEAVVKDFGNVTPRIGPDRLRDLVIGAAEKVLDMKWAVTGNNDIAEVRKRLTDAGLYGQGNFVKSVSLATDGHLRYEFDDANADPLAVGKFFREVTLDSAGKNKYFQPEDAIAMDARPYESGGKRHDSNGLLNEIRKADRRPYGALDMLDAIAATASDQDAALKAGRALLKEATGIVLDKTDPARNDAEWDRWLKGYLYTTRNNRNIELSVNQTLVGRFATTKPGVTRTPVVKIGDSIPLTSRARLVNWSLSELDPNDRSYEAALREAWAEHNITPIESMPSGVGGKIMTVMTDRPMSLADEADILFEAVQNRLGVEIHLENDADFPMGEMADALSRPTLKAAYLSRVEGPNGSLASGMRFLMNGGTYGENGSQTWPGLLKRVRDEYDQFGGFDKAFLDEYGKRTIQIPDADLTNDLLSSLQYVADFMSMAESLDISKLGDKTYADIAISLQDARDLATRVNETDIAGAVDALLQRIKGEDQAASLTDLVRLGKLTQDITTTMIDVRQKFALGLARIRDNAGTAAINARIALLNELSQWDAVTKLRESGGRLAPVVDLVEKIVKARSTLDENIERISALSDEKLARETAYKFMAYGMQYFVSGEPSKRGGHMEVSAGLVNRLDPADPVLREIDTLYDGKGQMRVFFTPEVKADGAFGSISDGESWWPGFVRRAADAIVGGSHSGDKLSFRDPLGSLFKIMMKSSDGLARAGRTMRVRTVLPGGLAINVADVHITGNDIVLSGTMTKQVSPAFLKLLGLSDTQALQALAGLGTNDGIMLNLSRENAKAFVAHLGLQAPRSTGAQSVAAMNRQAPMANLNMNTVFNRRIAALQNLDVFGKLARRGLDSDDVTERRNRMYSGYEYDAENAGVFADLAAWGGGFSEKFDQALLDPADRERTAFAALSADLLVDMLREEGNRSGIDAEYKKTLRAAENDLRSWLDARNNGTAPTGLGTLFTGALDILARPKDGVIQKDGEGKYYLTVTRFPVQAEAQFAMLPIAGIRGTGEHAGVEISNAAKALLKADFDGDTVIGYRIPLKDYQDAISKSPLASGRFFTDLQSFYARGVKSVEDNIPDIRFTSPASGGSTFDDLIADQSATQLSVDGLHVGSDAAMLLLYSGSGQPEKRRIIEAAVKGVSGLADPNYRTEYGSTDPFIISDSFSMGYHPDRSVIFDDQGTGFNFHGGIDLDVHGALTGITVNGMKRQYRFVSGQAGGGSYVQLRENDGVRAGERVVTEFSTESPMSHDHLAAFMKVFSGARGDEKSRIAVLGAGVGKAVQDNYHADDRKRAVSISQLIQQVQNSGPDTPKYHGARRMVQLAREYAAGDKTRNMSSYFSELVFGLHIASQFEINGRTKEGFTHRGIEPRATDTDVKTTVSSAYAKDSANVIGRAIATLRSSGDGLGFKDVAAVVRLGGQDANAYFELLRRVDNTGDPLGRLARQVLDNDVDEDFPPFVRERLLRMAIQARELRAMKFSDRSSALDWDTVPEFVKGELPYVRWDARLLDIRKDAEGKVIDPDEGAKRRMLDVLGAGRQDFVIEGHLQEALRRINLLREVYGSGAFYTVHRAYAGAIDNLPLALNRADVRDTADLVKQVGTALRNSGTPLSRQRLQEILTSDKYLGLSVSDLKGIPVDYEKAVRDLLTSSSQSLDPERPYREFLGRLSESGEAVRPGRALAYAGKAGESKLLTPEMLGVRYEQALKKLGNDLQEVDDLRTAYAGLIAALDPGAANLVRLRSSGLTKSFVRAYSKASENGARADLKMNWDDALDLIRAVRESSGMSLLSRHDMTFDMLRALNEPVGKIYQCR